MNTQVLTEELRPQLPPFVQRYLEELILDDCQFEEDEQVRREREQQLLAETTYIKVSGTIEHPYQNVSKQVHFWIGSHDEGRLHIHIGGSGCWLLPDNHYIFFQPIDPLSLPVEPDRQIWWVITGGYTVYQIQLRRESEVAEEFPDIG